MGKKGSWFSAIKRVFSSSSNEKQTNGSGRKSTKEKKTHRRVLKHVESRSFIPLFREPSSIEKILGEADQQKLFISAPTSSELPKIPWSFPTGTKSSRASSPQAVSPRTASPKVASPKADSRATATRIASPSIASSPVVAQYGGKEKNAIRTEPTVRNLHLSATRIQAAYRGYMARRSFRALKGLVRLQAVIRGQNVKRQTVNTMKKMQLLVRVQTQIQLRRLQMSENQAAQHQSYRNDKEVESTLSKWALEQLSDVGNNEDWDDSLLTKEEVDKRLRKKVEAIINRERAMAYAYSHQRLWKGNPESAHTAMDFKSNGFPWWHNWSENQLSVANSSEPQSAKNNDQSTHQTPMLKHKPSPRVQGSSYRQQPYAFVNHDSETPRSSKSMVPFRGKQYQTPTRTASRTPPPNRARPLGSRDSKGDSPFNVPMNDTDSLTSCPPFSMPNYMAPTASAMAKARPQSNPKEREIVTPRNDSKRRFSFPLTPSIGPFKWSRGSNKDSASQKGGQEHHSTRSIGEVSIDSTVSMPALGGRKPFNRFV